MEGTRFETCYPQGVYTFPSHVSLLTSIHRATHRLTNGDVFKYSVDTLADYLKTHGYATAGFVSNGMIAGDLGFREHFDIYDDGLSYHDGQSATFSRPADVTTAAMLSWLDQHHTQPAFIFLHFNDCHAPYRTPAPYSTLFENDNLGVQSENLPIRPGITQVITPEYALDGHTDTNYYVSQYDSAIRYIDDHVKLVLEYLRDHELLDNSLIVLTGDHGEAMGEHDVYFMHGKGFYEEFIRIPLIFSGMSITERKTVTVPARHIDVLPTIMDVLGIMDLPEYVQGTSLLPLMQGARVWLPNIDLFDIKVTSAYIRYKNWKYITTNDYSLALPTKGTAEAKRYIKRMIRHRKDELYRLDSDPGELFNVAELEKERTADLRRRLQSLLVKYDPIELSEHISDDAPVVDEAVINERLRMLGYID